MIKRIMSTLVRVLLPSHTLEPLSYINGLKSNLQELKNSNYEQRDRIRTLEGLVAQRFTLPKNFDTAVEQITGMTSKAKATFLFRLVKGLEQEDIEVLEKYMNTRVK
jgi:hypothetical protein